MQTTISCPHCQVKLRVRETSLGKMVKCPGCGQPFTAEPAAAAPPPLPSPGAFEEVSDPRPMAPPSRPRPAEEQFAGIPRSAWEELPEESPESDEAMAWRGVGTGLWLQIYAHFIYLGMWATVFVLSLIALAMESGPPGRAMFYLVSFFIILIGLTGMGQGFLSIVSSCFWMSSPKRYNSWSLAVGMLIFNTFVVFRLGDLLPGLISLTRRDMGGGREMGVASGFLLYFAGDVARLTFLPIFLNSLAKNVRSGGLAFTSRLLGMITPAIFGALFFILWILAMAAGEGKAVAIITQLLITGSYVGILVWGALVLMRARSEVRSKFVATLSEGSPRS